MPEKTGDLSGVQPLRADLDRLIDAVAEMRHCQIEYFRTKSQTALEASKRAEKKVDKLLQEIREPRLFSRLFW